jgi:hypothetical protein
MLFCLKPVFNLSEYIVFCVSFCDSHAVLTVNSFDVLHVALTLIDVLL